MRPPVTRRTIAGRTISRTVMSWRSAAPPVTAHTLFQRSHALFGRQVGDDLDNGEFDLAFHVTARFAQILHRRPDSFGVERLLTQRSLNCHLRVANIAQTRDHIVAAFP